MDINILKAELPNLLPKAIQWAEDTEEYIIKQGIALNKTQQADAKTVGVIHPEKIYVLELDIFPLPEDPTLQKAATTLGLLGKNTVGLTLGYGILIKKGLLSRSLLSHECRHVYQYEQEGSVAAFIKAYLASIIEYGYFDSPYEIDARKYEIFQL
ncbi:hypothetical protein [Entomomonas asaccharolytica]|uniref:DUF4157 domain-containing protein n=1 Tax=Entomomonas asaccharolytica TaxID=2785331 RepID=A0A974NCT0_9GAMM|nr:hypothetical protein [Entomomonas asaccharolytica]QQP84371.1 hypothetical protein JHT90_07990 [Entomomonas asaccharolytica]